MTRSRWFKFWLHKTTPDSRGNKDVLYSIHSCQTHWWNQLCQQQSHTFLQPLVSMQGHCFLQLHTHLNFHQHVLIWNVKSFTKKAKQVNFALFTFLATYSWAIQIFRAHCILTEFVLMLLFLWWYATAGNVRCAKSPTY